MEKKPLVIIGGATGVGKSELSIRLAKQINGEVISADSMQVYRRFDIGTAKISPEEMCGIPHHLIDILDPDQEFNVYEFKRLATQAIDDICSRGHTPVIVGGTGFYIQSVIYDIDFTDQSPDTAYRDQLEALANEHGGIYLHNMLKEKDPASAEIIHQNNIKRMIRALEYLHETGEPISEHNEEQRRRSSPYNFAYFVLDRERKTIYDRINKRVDFMMEQGLEDEIRSLLGSGLSRSCPAIQGIGYKEISAYIDGEMTLDEAVSLLKQHTRNFAKRQNTWFKREKDVIWMRYEDFSSTDEMTAEMLHILKQKGIANV